MDVKLEQLNASVKRTPDGEVPEEEYGLYSSKIENIEKSRESIERGRAHIDEKYFSDARRLHRTYDQGAGSYAIRCIHRDLADISAKIDALQSEVRELSWRIKKL